MTIDEFFDQLKNLGPWERGGHFGTAIRDKNGLCPIQKVYLSQTNVFMEGTAYMECGRRMGLTTPETGSIFRASETEPDPHRDVNGHAVRQRLLATCNLL